MRSNQSLAEQAFERWISNFPESDHSYDRQRVVDFVKKASREKSCNFSTYEDFSARCRANKRLDDEMIERLWFAKGYMEELLQESEE